MSEQIALIEVPIVDITNAANRRLVQEAGRLDVLGNLCRVMTNGTCLEFWVGARRFEVSFEDLVATAGVAIAGHLKAEIHARVHAARAERAGIEADGFVTLHPTMQP